MLPGNFDETFESPGKPRKTCLQFASRLQELTDEELASRQEAAEFLLRDLGITFTVYGHESGTEKICPFDLLPRIVNGNEWDEIEKGLKQRIEALNLFVDDVYNDQKIIRDGIVPESLLKSSKTYRQQMEGFHAPQGAWCHISGVDVIYRRIDDDFLDPKHFNSNSVLGVHGLMDVYRAGSVTLANAPGTGVADGDSGGHL